MRASFFVWPLVTVFMFCLARPRYVCLESERAYNRRISRLLGSCTVSGDLMGHGLACVCIFDFGAPLGSPDWPSA